MPPLNETPARKRFLVPGRSQGTHLEGSHRPSTQTPGLSGLPQVSNSSIPRTPFASHGKPARDEDIDVGLEDGEESSPLVHSLEKRHYPRQPVDLIEDDSQYANDDRTNEFENIQTESTRKSDLDNQHYRPSSATKRRKLSHSSLQIKDTGLIPILQSVETDNTLYPESEDKNSIVADEVSHPKSEDEVLASSPDVNIETPKQSSRFRIVTPASTLPFASKSSFQASLSSMQRGPYPVIENTLPDAFSPSRRKGGQDYLHDGMASTVRKWILELAAEESRVTNKAESHPRIQVAKVAKDPNGRFALVEDESNNLWLLPCAQQTRTSRPSSASDLQRIKVGSEIRFKGSQGSCWELPLPASDSDDQQICSRSCTVAVLWDVVSHSLDES